MSPGEPKAGASPITLGPRFVEAVAWAAELHANQARKGTTIPYTSHLLAVAGLVLEDGGTETEATAAMLHDAVEDQGVDPAEIEQRCGTAVADIVRGCTDVLDDETGRGSETSWVRKEAHLARLADPATGPSVLRVAAADKLHNARSILADYRRQGEEVWERFNVGRDGQLGYFRASADLLRERLPGWLTDELEATVAEMERMTAAGAQ